MSPKLWSDEDRLFIPRLGGWSISFKHIARKLGWIKSVPVAVLTETDSPADEVPETSDDRLRRSVDRSRFEDR
ncbi:hypothetical protein ACFLSG_01515 [Candidatus Bipolaricaulota bacterium]